MFGLWLQQQKGSLMQDLRIKELEAKVKELAATVGRLEGILAIKQIEFVPTYPQPYPVPYIPMPDDRWSPYIPWHHPYEITCTDQNTAFSTQGEQTCASLQLSSS